MRRDETMAGNTHRVLSRYVGMHSASDYFRVGRRGPIRRVVRPVSPSGHKFTILANPYPLPGTRAHRIPWNTKCAKKLNLMEALCWFKPMAAR